MSLVPCGRDGKKKQGALSPPLHDVEGTGRTCSQGLACRTFLSRLSEALGRCQKNRTSRTCLQSLTCPRRLPALVSAVPGAAGPSEELAASEGRAEAGPEGMSVRGRPCIRGAGPVEHEPAQPLLQLQPPEQLPVQGPALPLQQPVPLRRTRRRRARMAQATRTRARTRSVTLMQNLSPGDFSSGDFSSGDRRRQWETAERQGNESVVVRQKRRSGLGPCGELLRESAQGDLPGEPWTREALWRRDRRRKKGQAFCLNSSEFLSWPCQTSCQTFWQKRDRVV